MLAVRSVADDRDAVLLAPRHHCVLDAALFEVIQHLVTRDAAGPEFGVASQTLSIGQAIAVPLAAADLKSFTSVIGFAPGEFRFAPDGDHLGVTYVDHGVAQGSPQPLVHVGHDTFESIERRMRVQFTRSQNLVTALELSLGEMTVRAKFPPH